jgi:hypothetical protein
MDSSKYRAYLHRSIPPCISVVRTARNRFHLQCVCTWRDNHLVAVLAPVLVSVWVALLEVVCPRILIDQTLSACVRCSSCMTSIHSAQASMCHLGTADTVHCLNQNILVCI